MASPVLPRIARLDVRRVAFLLKLQPLPGFSRTHCLFDSKGGELRRFASKGSQGSGEVVSGFDFVEQSVEQNASNG